MSIRDQLVELAKPKFHCSCCDWLAGRSDDDRAAVDEWLTDPNRSVAALVKVLRAEGLPVKVQQFRRHVQECVRS